MAVVDVRGRSAGESAVEGRSGGGGMGVREGEVRVVSLLVSFFGMGVWLLDVED